MSATASPTTVHDMKPLGTSEPLRAFREAPALGDGRSLLRGDAADVQTDAAVLGVCHRPGVDGSGVHSSLITLLGAGGDVVARREGLRTDPSPAVAALHAAQYPSPPTSMSSLRRSMLALGFGLALTSCGGDDAPETVTTPAPAPAAPAAPAVTEAPAAYEGEAAEITLTPLGEQMKFAETEFTVHPGQEVHLTFTNTATNEAMHHNVAVLKSASDVQTVGIAAASASETDYIAPRTQNLVLAHTPMSAPGETVEVTFTAPAAGDYPYICTFPGHFASMKGTMHVVQ